MFVPMDVFTVLCVELVKTSEDVLTSTKAVTWAENAGYEVKPMLLDALISCNNHITNMEQILKAIMEENPSPGTLTVGGHDA